MTIRDKLGQLKWAALGRLVGPHGVSALSTAIPHGERTLEYPWVLNAVGSLTPPPARILDVGCGPVSILPLWLRNVGYDVSCCDLRPSQRAIPDVRFVVGDIAEITSLAEGSFDIVTCISVFEHVGIGGYDGKERSEPVAFLRALKRFVKPGGRIVMTFPFGKDGFCRLDPIAAYRVISEQYLLQVLWSAGLSDFHLTCFKLTDRYWYPCSLDEASSVDSTVDVTAIGGIVIPVP